MPSTIQSVDLSNDRHFVHYLVRQSARDAERRAADDRIAKWSAGERMCERADIAARTIVFVAVMALLWVLFGR